MLKPKVVLRVCPGSNHGRCSDGDFNQYVQELGPACCGPSGSYCPQNLALAAAGQPPTLEVPMMGRQPVRIDQCRSGTEEFYAECNPRIAAADPGAAAGIEQFLAMCQGIPPVAAMGPGGGH